MWRKIYAIEWTVEDDVLWVKASWEGNTFMLPPFAPSMAPVGRTIDKVIAYFALNGWPFEIRGMENDIKSWFEELKPGYFNYENDRDNYDYIYNSQDLIELAGRKYHSKKNHVNSFRKHYADYQYLPLTTEWTDKCIVNIIEWCRKRGCTKGDSLDCEKNAIIEALTHFTTLGFQGGLITLDDKVEAFTFGEAINNDTAVIHVEKGNPDIKGIYAVINQEFCRENWQQFTYINREEDMGIEGLRKAKESYQPVKMIEKLNVTVK
jgi:hypothetical protein